MTNARRSLLEQRRELNERISSVVVQHSWVPGRVQVQGVGEFQFEVDFGLTFSERPILIPGAPELEDSAPEVQHLPSVEMSVSNWKRRNDNTGTRNHYTGATIIARVAGRSSQVISLPYIFFGKAFSSLAIEGAIED